MVDVTAYEALAVAARRHLRSFVVLRMRVRPPRLPPPPSPCDMPTERIVHQISAS